MQDIPGNKIFIESFKPICTNCRMHCNNETEWIELTYYLLHECLRN